MISEKQIDALIKRLMDRMQEANTYFLEQIGTSLKKIGTLTPSKAYQLVQILKYGGSYEEIVKEISRITNLNVKEVDTIFKEYAKKDQMFYEDFYKFRNVPFIKYEDNMLLRNQTQALANIMKNEMYNYLRDNVIGYSYRDVNGDVVFKGLRETYNDLLDRALMNVGQGKETFDNAMRDVLKELGGSGLRTLDYESGRSIRLDSAVKMHLKGRLRELHNENQRLIAQEIDADGVEISVHEYPAPDHEDAQGRQFTANKYDKNGKLIKQGEFEKLQEIGIAKDYTGKEIDLHKELVSGEIPDYFRPISEMNCYHYIFAIVLGVNKPQYSDEQLQEIKKRNEAGFDYNGKHYTMYEGTQMQRRLETAIREQKDIKTIGEASGDNKIVLEANAKIKAYRQKYNELNEISGLKGKAKRLSITKTSNKPEPKVETKIEPTEPKVELLESKFEKESKIFKHSKQWLDLDDPDNVKIYNATNKLDISIYERKGLKKAKYVSEDKQISTAGVDTSNLNDKQATTTLWHELGHSLDNNNFKEYLSDNKDLRMKMFDFHSENKDVPQKIKDYFDNVKQRVDDKYTKEYKSQVNEEVFIKDRIKELKDSPFYENWTMEELKQNAQNRYNSGLNRYLREHRYEDMDYAQRLNFSDMFSAISNGRYEWCKKYGYHTKKYFDYATKNPSTELFANFTSLKMTGRYK